eukprot:108986-Chlamydomonas_euryale.AAC.1
MVRGRAVPPRSSAQLRRRQRGRNGAGERGDGLLAPHTRQGGKCQAAAMYGGAGGRLARDAPASHRMAFMNMHSSAAFGVICTSPRSSPPHQVGRTRRNDAFRCRLRKEGCHPIGAPWGFRLDMFALNVLHVALTLPCWRMDAGHGRLEL